MYGSKTRFGPIHVENFALARIFLQFNRFWNYMCLSNSGKLLANQQINAFWTHTCGKFCLCNDIPAIQQVLELYVFEKFWQAFGKSTDQRVLDPYISKFLLLRGDFCNSTGFGTIHVQKFWQAFGKSTDQNVLDPYISKIMLLQGDFCNSTGFGTIHVQIFLTSFCKSTDQRVLEPYMLKILLLQGYSCKST